SGTASLTDQYLDQLTRTTGTTAGIPATYSQVKGSTAQQSYGLTATQTLFNGFQTATRTRQAEGQVFSARETLRTIEQNGLLQAATAYMNLLQTAAILELQRSNVNVLEVTLRQTRDRFTAGEVTRTDVAQAESRLSVGRSQLSLAQSNYVTAQAQYLQGAEHAAIRQSKETLGERRIDLDTARDQVQATVTQAWGQLEAAKAQIDATQPQVPAAEVALMGVREEARVGQRTTLDVLNAQQDLVKARVALVTAQRDRVVASYTMLAATAAPSPQILGLRTEVYDPVVHYQQARDAWGGVRVPDGW